MIFRNVRCKEFILPKSFIQNRDPKMALSDDRKRTRWS